VVPELKLGDDVILSGAAMNLGHEVRFTYIPELAGGRIGAANPYNVIAGSYLAVAAIAGNVGGITLETARQEIESVRQIIQSGIPSEVQPLSREAVLGNFLFAGLLGYYGQYVEMSKELGSRQGGHHYLSAGLGTFGYEPDVHVVLGMPMAVQRGAAIMNMPILSTFGYDGDGSVEARHARNNFILQVGVLSSVLEHVGARFRHRKPHVVGALFIHPDRLQHRPAEPAHDRNAELFQGNAKRHREVHALFCSRVSGWQT
jgi:hypothetical protein